MVSFKIVLVTSMSDITEKITSIRRHCRDLSMLACLFSQTIVCSAKTKDEIVAEVTNLKNFKGSKPNLVSDIPIWDSRIRRVL